MQECLERLERQAQRLVANIELIRRERERLLEIEQNLADTAQALLLMVEIERDRGDAPAASDHEADGLIL